MDTPPPRVDAPPEPAPADAGGEAQGEPSYQERFEHLRLLTMQLLTLAKTYLGIRADQVSVRVRRAMLRAAIIVAFTVVVLALMVYSTVLVLLGTAGGLAVLFGNRPWLGELVTGVVSLGGLALFAWAWIGSQKRQAREKIHARYDALKAVRASAETAMKEGKNG